MCPASEPSTSVSARQSTPWSSATRGSHSDATVFRAAWQTALSAHNIQKGFSHCGIVPYNPAKVMERYEGVLVGTKLTPAHAVDLNPAPQLMLPTPFTPPPARTTAPTTLSKLSRHGLHATILKRDLEITRLQTELARTQHGYATQLMRLPLAEVTNDAAGNPAKRRKVAAHRSVDGKARVITSRQLNESILADEEAKAAARALKASTKSADTPSRKRKRAQPTPVDDTEDPTSVHIA